MLNQEIIIDYLSSYQMVVQDTLMLSRILNKGVFAELKDIDYFKLVKPLFCGIVWPNEQDLSTDTIAYEMKNISNFSE